MNRSAWRRAFGLTVLTLVTTGCTEKVVGPMDGQTFVLRTVDGDPLPFAVEIEGEFRWTVIADTIWFTRGDNWARRTVQLRQQLPGGSEDFQDFETDGFVTRDGNGVVLDSVCEDTASCVEPDRLFPVGDVLQLRRTSFHAGTNLVFRPLE